ncbi:tetratricopeptide repeat protein [Mesohalobacter halotolerans]|uniref:Tetratricopeptide repeat protein n=1 Tax=Mesohalobacter halotolerans TaxID=1883405 RepID=A0A4U5TT38_9FLAO|nr:tetratricopeptide repeat protein [Mesohalobacter halotolerans]TKS57202.1 tetratricopeptide repeat protein [Mesohalobacter halotolerans]
MKNNTLIILLILTTISSCKSDLSSESKKEKITTLNNKAVEMRMNGELSEAEKLYEQAFQIDNTNLNIHFSLLGIYIQKGEIKKAFDFLENLPEKQKKTVYYFQTKGNLLEYDGRIKEAKEQYKKALELSEIGTIRDEQDLNRLVNYTMLETYAGKKDSAVNRINQVLKFDWLTNSNKEYLETFRNEFEFYQDNGALDFQNEKIIKICTTNIDSLKQVLSENHINISGSSFPIGKNDKGEIRIKEKYRSGINLLGIRECD